VLARVNGDERMSFGFGSPFGGIAGTNRTRQRGA